MDNSFKWLIQTPPPGENVAIRIDFVYGESQTGTSSSFFVFADEFGMISHPDFAGKDVLFELTAVQKNFEGAITAVKGNVTLFNEQREEVKQDMLWNLKGQAMLIGEQFDLINEMDYAAESDETPVVAQPSANPQHN